MSWYLRVACRFAMTHKYRNNKDSYEMDELFRMKHQKLLTVGELRRCRKKGVNPDETPEAFDRW